MSGGRVPGRSARGRQATYVSSHSSRNRMAIDVVTQSVGHVKVALTAGPEATWQADVGVGATRRD
jgi:hypothetical protein